MKRGKKIALLAHCILNVNSKIKGLANYSSINWEILDDLRERDLAIIQLPCPEITFLGMDRWGMTKNQYDNEMYRSHCRNILSSIINQLVEYEKQGYEIVELIGIDGSPSCGVNYTETGYEGGLIEVEKNIASNRIDEKGVFMEELLKLLEKEKISLKITGIDEK